MRYICVGCDKDYGEGKNKPQRGYCSNCWNKFLLSAKENGDKLMAHWIEQKKLDQRKQYLIHLLAPVTQPISKYAFKWYGFKFFLVSLINRFNAKVCKWFGIPVRRRILPRIKIILSRD